MGSKMSPVLDDIVMKKWEEENIDKERRIRRFTRYVDDSLGIWRGEKRELEEKMKELEDNEKGIEIKLEIEKDNSINFLDSKLIITK